MKTTVTVGLTALAGTALLETTLIPGITIGGIAVLAPRYLPTGAPRHATKAVPQRTAPDASREPPNQGEPQTLLPKFAIGQAVAKTVTFRIIVTTIDFSTNYLAIGEIATAAGIIDLQLIAGPLFYLAHEAAWSYWGPPDDAVFALRAAPTGTNGAGERRGLGRLTVSRALANTVTFWVIASTMDFATTMWWCVTSARR